jgi:outer membrane lipoprotein SlyB
LSFRFTEVLAYGETYTIRTAPFVYEAAGTKAEDAKKIGIGAATGALIGGLTGGKKGAVVGSAIGGGAGTALVVTTPGDEVGVRSGRTLRMQLTDALTVQVPREDTGARSRR